MNNATYVCFDCRTTERTPAWRITRNCRRCRKTAQHVYYKFRIPRRGDDAGWAELETRVRSYNRAIQSQVLPRLRKEKDWIERILSTYPDLRPYRRRMLMRQIRRIEEERAGWLEW